MTPDNLASLAASLRDNEAFQSALSAIRSDALEALAIADPTDPTQLYGLQATVKVVDNLHERIRLMISAGAVKKPPGIA